MLKTVAALALGLAARAGAICVDDPLFVDELGQVCSTYAALPSCNDAVGLTDNGLARVLQFCQLSCNTCVKAADICEIGLGGNPIVVDSATANFDFIDEPFLTTTCNWIDTPEGMRQTTNAWGNTPGENQVMGCMAIIKNSMYTDFIMEVEARHEDDDASGIIFGMDPANPEIFYKSMMFNDDWMDNPTDSVQGPFIKLNYRNGIPCNGTMTPATDCYSLLSYNANDFAQDASLFPNGMLSSNSYIPDDYAQTYDPFEQRSTTSGFAKTVLFTLIVYQGEARVYFKSRGNKIVGTWATLPADYAGGMVGLFMGAHQATYTSITIVDLTNGSPFTNPCKFPGATCDQTVGLCLGGPSPAPTSFPTPAPTFFDNCQDPYRHAASDFCPNPEGGAVVTYDTSDLNAWEFFQQSPVSENCTWSADATGLSQTSNAWGTWPTSQLLLGCIALVPDTYTDFIAEYEAVHFDNDAWGFVFGWNGMFDHWTAATHNDAWPSNALDGISGPYTKIRKTTGSECSDQMTVDNACYETLGFTDQNGFSDTSNIRESMQRNKEYEYTHAYAASASFQPAKITLIVQGQEARIVYKSPDTFTDAPQNNVRQGNKYQAAMAFDLKGYAGGRVGIFMSAHQMVVSNFKITDISDPANLPTGYCGGAYCDAGITGLCMGIAAPGICEGAVNPDVYDTTNIDIFDYIEDPTLGISCSWNYGPNGFVYQSSNAYRNDGTLLGCNALLKDATYTDFVAEMWLDNNDNDAVGFNFGWQSTDDHFRVHKINDAWQQELADYVAMPHFKVQRKIPGASCAGETNASNPCYQTIAFVDVNGAFHADISPDAVTASGECGYSQTYLPYDQAERSKMYLIVKDNQMRATYESPLSRRQVTAMAFDLGKYNYVGGRVGIFLFAHQAEFFEFTVADLNKVTQFCDGDPCSDRSGRCLGSPTMAPTFVPTGTPTTFPTPNVAANEYCQGPVSATATTVVDATDISQFLLVDHPKLTTACAWSADASGLSQTSEAWGNAPGDNTLMGCMAIFQGASYTDFIAEIDVTQIDNDGWGVVFGYNAIDDHYLGIAMNDRWPQPAADDIPGPFLKMKKHNGKEVLDVMDASNVCFDTITHLDGNGFNKAAMQGGTGVGLPKEYESTYSYRKGAAFENTKIVLIIKGTEARLYFPTPSVDRLTPWNNLRTSQTMTGVWTFDLAGYTGGQIGVFTYAHQATFSNWKITDLTDETAITGYCDGNPDMFCDNQRGDASTGLCFAVPMADVCEGPVGDGVVSIPTTSMDAWEFIEDPYELTTPCVWELGSSGYLRQSANTNRNQGILLACNAIAVNQTFTDVLLQVDIDNDDNDAVGFNFGWKSVDDHFRMHKINDIWPNPASDYVNGPGMKVKRKVPGAICYDFNQINVTEDVCYQTIAFADQYGVYHDSQPLGSVVPFDYARSYIPYEQGDIKRLILMIREQKMRVMYEDVTLGKYVAAFAFDMTPYQYTGGRVGLFTWAHQASFLSFIAAPLSGPTAVTQFCNGGICDTNMGLCSTQPTLNPTARFGDIAVADMCPGPVGGAMTMIDTSDLSQFTLVDQDLLSEPCQWSAGPDGLTQASNAFGNVPGTNTLMGCIALFGDTTYTDFMVEVTASHDADDAWGFVFGFMAQGTPSHYIATANNAMWPSPAADGIMGPFAKMKKTNGNPCLETMDASNNCYDTISYTDASGTYVDGALVTDMPGEIARYYPYRAGDTWPDRKMTLIVKDGEARMVIAGPELMRASPINAMRQPTRYVSTWTYGLDAAGYTGGSVGLFVYAHAATFTNLTITDLSDDANLPTDYCGGMATCANGVCTKVPVADVCEDPVGATVIDTTQLGNFDYIDDPEINNGPCSWVVRDLGKGPFLYQETNAHGSLEVIGCNAVYNGPSFTDFIMQFDVDNYDNDGVGFVFGWNSLTDHFKVHKRIDTWPSPAADWVDGPNFKVSRRTDAFPCVIGMNETNACYQAVAFADNGGVFHQAMPMDAIQPWQYSVKYLDYEIGLGVNDTVARMVLMVRGNELRTYFTPMDNPNLRVPAFAFDLSAYGYAGGKVGLHMYAHQAQFLDVRIAPLSGANAATEFCASGGTCNSMTGLCE